MKETPQKSNFAYVVALVGLVHRGHLKRTLSYFIARCANSGWVLLGSQEQKNKM